MRHIKWPCSLRNTILHESLCRVLRLIWDMIRGLSKSLKKNWEEVRIGNKFSNKEQSNRKIISKSYRREWMRLLTNSMISINRADQLTGTLLLHLKQIQAHKHQLMNLINSWMKSKTSLKSAKIALKKQTWRSMT